MNALDKSDSAFSDKRKSQHPGESAIQNPVDFKSPLRLVLTIALCVFFGETFVMVVLSFLPAWKTWFEALFNAGVLIILLSPVLFLFIYRPFVQHITDLNSAHKVLDELNNELENKAAERMAELRSNEEQLRSITDNLPGLISYVDKNLRYRFLNRVYEEWFKLPRKEIYGKHIRELLGKEAFENIKEYLEKALSGQKAY